MIKKHKAGISIFLIIVTMANVTFGGLFIDLTRVLVAKNRVRTAAESAVRSALAGYSENLVSEWGLFGVTENEAKTGYSKYLRLNLTTENTNGNAGLIKYEIVSSEATCSKPLGDKDVFAEKINEYEKYRAPVSLTLGVIDKFKAIFGDDNAIDNLQLDVKGAISGTTSKMKRSFNNLRTIKSNFNSEVDSSGAKLSNSSSGELAEVDINSLDTLKGNLNTSIDNSKSKVDGYKESISDYQKAGDDMQAKTDSVKGKVNTSGANGEIDDNSKKIDENINTYEENIAVNNGKVTVGEGDNKTEIDFDAKQNSQIAAGDAMRDKEERLIDQTNASADDANIKAEALRRTMDSKVDEAKNLAIDYNNAKNTFNATYASLNTAVQMACGIQSGYTADTAMSKYPDEAAVKAARKRVEEIDTTLAENIAKLNNLKYIPKEDEIKEKRELLDKMRSQLIKLENTFDKDYSDEVMVFRVIDEESKFSEIKSAWTEYAGKDENKDKDITVTDVLTYYNQKITDLNTEVTEAESGLKELREAENKIAEYKGKQMEPAYKLDKFAMNNSSIIFRAIAEKNTAVQKGNTYNKKLNEIKNTSTYQAMEVDKVDNFTKLALDNVEESDEDDEEDSFDASELFSIPGKIRELCKDMAAEMPSAASVQASDLEAEDKKVDMFQKLLDYFNDLGEFINNPGDKFYLVDYIMGKCTYLTSQTSRNHFFKYGEVEYIIFGGSSQIENLVASVGSITLMRFAINAVNYFIKTPGEMISRIVSALLCGLTQTVADMTTMLLDTGMGSDKGLIAICPSLSKYKVLSYSDHLRILLLMKISGDGGGDALRRCIHATLLQQGESIKPLYDTSNGKKAWTSDQYLGEYYTEITGKAEVDVDLFFIPLFLPDFVNFGSIHDGKFRVSTSITYGY